MTGRKKGTKKERINIWVTSDIMQNLRREARERHVALCRIIETALMKRYSPLTQEEQEALIARRLNRIDIKLRTLERQLEISAECLALFVRMWLSSAPEVPESQRDAAYMKGQGRYERYIKSVSKRLQVGQSVFTDLPREVVVKEEDWGKGET